MKENFHIYELNDKCFKEKEYLELKLKLKKDDVLIFKSLDQLGRNYNDIKKELNFLYKKARVDIVVLDMPAFDTRVNKEINGTLIVDLVCQFLDHIVIAEKNFRSQRQAEGIENAKQKGVQMGRPPAPYPKGFVPIYNKVINKEISKTEGAAILGITFHAMGRFVIRKTAELGKKS